MTLTQLRRHVSREKGHHLWRGAKTSDGYGAVRVLGVWRRAHRAIFEGRHGPLKKGELVRHRCDTPLCIKLTHLTKGSRKQNVRDALRRGRWAGRGIKSKLSHMRAATLREAKLGGASLATLAATFGISQSHAKQVASGRYWKRK